MELSKIPSFKMGKMGLGLGIGWRLGIGAVLGIGLAGGIGHGSWIGLPMGIGQVSSAEARAEEPLIGRTAQTPAPSAAQGGVVEPADAQRIAAAGIRRLVGKHLILYTDLGLDPEVDVLPEVFDQAFEPWCSYFAVDPDKHSGWKMTGRLMREPERFRRAGLLPEGLPKFANGFTKSYDFWIYEQPSAYYRRHLMLHEGVHGFMLTLLGSCGPTWYMEGVAELLATHRWQDGRLLLKYFPGASEQVPMWGRVKIVRDAAQRRGLLAVEQLIRMTPEISGENELYGWCWALAAFLDNHPRYQSAFRQMVSWVREKDFTNRFFRSLGEDRHFLDEEWKLFVDEICYGYDIGRCAIDFVPGRPIPGEGVQVRVAADRGWQSSGWRVEAGRTYHLTATGRYQVAEQPKVWWCEPGGVTIRYYRGRPLGMLLAAIRPEPGVVRGESAAVGPELAGVPPLSAAVGYDSPSKGLTESSPSKPKALHRADNHLGDWLQGNRSVPPSVQTAPSPSKQQSLETPGTSVGQRSSSADGLAESARSGLLQPIPIGLEATLKPAESGTLYFRINESPAQLGDNAGELTVRITPEK